jgi:hypothetical protein
MRPRKPETRHNLRDRYDHFHLEVLSLEKTLCSHAGVVISDGSPKVKQLQ